MSDARTNGALHTPKYLHRRVKPFLPHHNHAPWVVLPIHVHNLYIHFLVLHRFRTSDDWKGLHYTILQLGFQYWTKRRAVDPRAAVAEAETSKGSFDAVLVYTRSTRRTEGSGLHLNQGFHKSGYPKIDGLSWNIPSRNDLNWWELGVPPWRNGNFQMLWRTIPLRSTYSHLSGTKPPLDAPHQRHDWLLGCWSVLQTFQTPEWWSLWACGWPVTNRHNVGRWPDLTNVSSFSVARRLKVQQPPGSQRVGESMSMWFSCLLWEFEKILTISFLHFMIEPLFGKFVLFFGI